MRFTITRILIVLVIYCVLLALMSPLMTDGSWQARVLLAFGILATPWYISATIAVFTRGPRFVQVRALLLVAAATGICLPHLQTVRECVSLAPACSFCLRATAIALHSYHSEHGVLPPVVSFDQQGKPQHSWRPLLAPYLGYHELKNYDTDVAWNAGSNKRLLNYRIRDYQCCYCAENQQGNQTTVVAVTGEQAVFSADGTAALETVEDTDAICFVSVTASGINCFEPRDFTINDLMDDSGNWLVSSEHGDGIWICRVDGSVRFLKNTCTKEELAALLSRAGGETVGQHVYGEQTRGDYFLTRDQEQRERHRWGIIGIYLLGLLIFPMQRWVHKHNTSTKDEETGGG